MAYNRLTVSRYERKSDEPTADAGQISPPISPGATPDEISQNIPEVSSVIRLQNGMVLYLREINKSVLHRPAPLGRILGFANDWILGSWR